MTVAPGSTLRDQIENFEKNRPVSIRPELLATCPYLPAEVKAQFTDVLTKLWTQQASRPHTFGALYATIAINKVSKEIVGYILAQRRIRSQNPALLAKPASTLVSSPPTRLCLTLAWLTLLVYSPLLSTSTPLLFIATLPPWRSRLVALTASKYAKSLLVFAFPSLQA